MSVEIKLGEAESNAEDNLILNEDNMNDYSFIDTIINSDGHEIVSWPFYGTSYLKLNNMMYPH